MSQIADTPTSSVPEIPVVLVDDHEIWRGGVRSMLSGTEFKVIGEASSGKEAVQLVGNTPPRIVLMDIRMAGGDGLDAMVSIKQKNPAVSVVMLTTYDHPNYIARAVAGGASSFLMKDVEREDLISTLRAVAEGEMLLSVDDLVRTLKEINPVNADMSALIDPLSEREVEVLRLVTMGMTNREIGSLLFVAESTVKTHVIHIIGKLGVSDRVQAAVWATLHGLGPGSA
ncbi:MAG: response regulator transcription factor [Chthonomonadales bacterium]